MNNQLPWIKITGYKFKCFVPFGDGEYYTVYIVQSRFLWFKFKRDYYFTMFYSIKQIEDYLNEKIN